MKKSVANLTIVSLLASPAGPVMGAQSSGSAPVPRAAAKAATTTSTPADGGWPRAYTTPTGARLVLYQPQVGSWPDQ